MFIGNPDSYDWFKCVHFMLIYHNISNIVNISFNVSWQKHSTVLTNQNSRQEGILCTPHLANWLRWVIFCVFEGLRQSLKGSLVVYVCSVQNVFWNRPCTFGLISKSARSKKIFVPRDSLADLGGASGARPPYGSRFFRFDIQNFWNVPTSGVHAPLYEVHAPPTGNPGSATETLAVIK